jgi:2-polyprenyl-3-methyl-5-hydroxy-6-metoxy-1,4-benzoquinol methylase
VLPLRIVRCCNCGLLYSDPAFKEEQLRFVYPNDIVAPHLSFTDCLRNSSKHTDLLQSIRGYLAEGVVCDLGARHGVLVHKASKAGFRALGVEYNADAVTIGQEAGVNLFQGTINDVPALLQQIGEESVDAFVMDDVLEHLAYPRRDLETMARCQKTGGYLFLRQMDTNSLGHLIYGRNWYYIQPAAHMYYFNRRTLSMLLEQVGYDVVHVRRMPWWYNLSVLTARVVRRKLRSIVLRPSTRPIWKVNGKDIYLIERFKSTDDMFLLVARKK